MRACLLLYAVAVLVIFGLWRRADAAWEQRSKARAYRKAQRASLDQLLDLSRPVPSETHPAGRRYEPESTVIVATAAVEPPTRWTEVTVPTSTPAIRTGEPRCSSVCTVNVALRMNGELANGSPPPNTR